MRHPYVGITGFMDSTESAHALRVFGSPSGTFNYKLMVGVLASARSVRGEEKRFANRYPSLRKIPSIFPNSNQSIGLIHYSTDYPNCLYQDMQALAEHCAHNPGFHGFQLNMNWPNVDDLKRWKNESLVGRTLVLSITSSCMHLAGNQPDVVAELVAKSYHGLVDYILLDPSGGRGQVFDLPTMLGYLRAFAQVGIIENLVVAGGLSSTNLVLARAIAGEFPGISIDAERKLRNQDDNLDLGESTYYLNAAKNVLCSF